MKYLSVCSGIEAASAAWHQLGWEPVGFSEIEPYPAAVLAHHYPTVTNFGDMTKYEQWSLGSDDVEVLVGGTPCQSFSVAGLRKGLDDDRGNLALTFCELANHFDPEWIIWENVPGVLSDKTNAFGCLLAGLAGEMEAIEPPGGRWKNAGYVFGSKRSVAWRILDAQYFGVAQRRRRVFVVASSGDVCASEILFEREGLRRDTAPSRETGERIAPCVTNGPPFSRTGNERVEAEAMVVSDWPAEIAPTLPSNAGGNTAPALLQSMAVRRLTPVECERLQGFPDSWTNIPWRNKDESPDGPRYKALGNSMAVPCMRWIGERIDRIRWLTEEA